MNVSDTGRFLSRVGGCYFGSDADRRRQRWFTSVAVLFAVTYVGGKWLLKSEAELAPLTQWLAIGVPNVLVVAGVAVYLKFLLGADELVRKVELEGLAIGFGLGVVVGLGYPLFEYAGWPPLDVKYLVALMLFGWVGGHLVAWKRYLS